MPDLDPDLPVCNFSGVTKQLQTDQFNEDQLALLDLCFPEFLDSDIRNGPLEHLGLRQPETAQPRPPDWGRLRRFAGSQDLSRGRYHTLCFGTEGNDGGTLLRELYAYWNESTNVLPIVKDTTLAAPATVDDIAHRSKRPLLKLEIEQHRKKRRLIRKPILESRSLAKISLPLAIEKIEIKNVIDLRLIEVQEWFYEQFTRLEHDIGMRGHTDTESGNTFRTVKFHKPRDFVDLIPTLVMPGIGGSSFHQAVGGWLRSHAVHALIYPSARCDAYIKKIHNTANGYKDYEFYGWNLIDYRDAGPASWDAQFGQLSSWVLPGKAGMRVKRLRNEVKGWQIEGAEIGEARRIRLGYDIMTGVVESVRWDVRGGFRRPFYTEGEIEPVSYSGKFGFSSDKTKADHCVNKPNDTASAAVSKTVKNSQKKGENKSEKDDTKKEKK